MHLPDELMFEPDCTLRTIGNGKYTESERTINPISICLSLLSLDCRSISYTLSLSSFSRSFFHCTSIHVSLLRHYLFFIFLAPSPYLSLSIFSSHFLCLTHIALLQSLSLSLSNTSQISSLFLPLSLFCLF